MSVVEDPNIQAESGISPDHFVSKEKFDSLVADFVKEDEDHVLLRETPADDLKPLGELLDIEEGDLPEFTCRLKKGAESCSNCGRHYSMLDVVKTAVQHHSKEFLRNTVLGKHGGYVFNPVVQLHRCYNCDVKAQAPILYTCRFGYMCQHPG